MDLTELQKFLNINDLYQLLQKELIRKSKSIKSSQQYPTITTTIIEPQPGTCIENGIIIEESNFCAYNGKIYLQEDTKTCACECGEFFTGKQCFTFDYKYLEHFRSIQDQVQVLQKGKGLGRNQFQDQGAPGDGTGMGNFLIQKSIIALLLAIILILFFTTWYFFDQNKKNFNKIHQMDELRQNDCDQQNHNQMKININQQDNFELDSYLNFMQTKKERPSISIIGIPRSRAVSARSLSNYNYPYGIRDRSVTVFRVEGGRNGARPVFGVKLVIINSECHNDNAQNNLA